MELHQRRELSDRSPRMTQPREVRHSQRSDAKSPWNTIVAWAVWDPGICLIQYMDMLGSSKLCRANSTGYWVFGKERPGILTTSWMCGITREAGIPLYSSRIFRVWFQFDLAIREDCLANSDSDLRRQLCRDVLVVKRGYFFVLVSSESFCVHRIRSLDGFSWFSGRHLEYLVKRFDSITEKERR